MPILDNFNRFNRQFHTQIPFWLAHASHSLSKSPRQRWSGSRAVHAGAGEVFGRAIEVTGVTNRLSERHGYNLAYLSVPE